MVPVYRRRSVAAGVNWRLNERQYGTALEMMEVAVVDGWPKPASSAARTLWVAAALERSALCVSVMVRWRACEIVQVDKRFWDR
ncbi:hypothetical protein [Caballeronia sp. S22]|uniref:hypothetical protein n=1 Tax=Caballeronia sp. S22 TaxID=3137182 RepID=UPI0035308CA0